MYIPKHFDEPRIDVMHELIRARPLATLVTLASSGLNANHIPLLLSEESSPLGTLRGHVARSNSIWNDYVKDVEVLAVFQGPDAYITPSWYPTKIENGKSVPTWNYAVAHAYGTLRVIDEASWLRAHLETLQMAVVSNLSKSNNGKNRTYRYDRIQAGVEGVISASFVPP